MGRPMPAAMTKQRARYCNNTSSLAASRISRENEAASAYKNEDV